ncbi:hypothetical protein JL106_14975 [Nakamurella sp. YIM 132084]|uniref:Uncharacterized protein n=1 Tax=Nakamurella leprariae TaxID=2803911 RepID=A0A938Y9M2_9ACTN|nr:hypothetical protein [Nakamurella leprariae]MBM9468586.1 hypothetical protein [Nakamurella leprariae]
MNHHHHGGRPESQEGPGGGNPFDQLRAMAEQFGGQFGGPGNDPAAWREMAREFMRNVAEAGAEFGKQGPAFARGAEGTESPGAPGAPFGFGPPRGRGGRRGGPFGGGRGPGGPGRGGRGGDVPDASDAEGWFAGRIPDGWFVGAPEVTIDRDEILVVGELPAPAAAAEAAAVEESEQPRASADGAAAGRIARFREETRAERIEIARQAQHRYGREISWGARVGDVEELFTTQSVPVMTRLRQPERQVLDTLVAAGVARSRSDALVWAVRLVGEHADSWLSELRDAMEAVDRLRAQGPGL